jgi:hypothetical protein
VSSYQAGNFLLRTSGLYIGKYPPPLRRGISAKVIWWKKCEKGKIKRGKM